MNRDDRDRDSVDCWVVSGLLFADNRLERQPGFTVADLPPEQRDDPYGYAALMSEFIACARDNRPPTIAADVRAGRSATAVTLACFESIRTSLPVTLAV